MKLEDPSELYPPVTFDEDDKSWKIAESQEYDMIDQNSAAHYARFLLCKLKSHHEKSLNLEMKNCSIYELHFSDEDLFVHLFTHLQRNSDGCGNTAELVYASKEFIHFVLQADEAFEYIFTKYCNMPRIQERIISFMKLKVASPKFCNEGLEKFMVDLYSRTKIEYKLKSINEQIDRDGDVEQSKTSRKFKTILHK